MQTQNDSILIKESIVIRRPREVVWDFTQDFSKRPLWDDSIHEVEVLGKSPNRTVRVRGRGFGCIFEYKAAERPLHTSVIMKDVVSGLVAGGGGSWRYEPHEDGSVWTQSMRIDLKQRWGLRFFIPLIAFMLRRQVRKSMRRARDMLETCDVPAAQSTTS